MMMKALETVVGSEGAKEGLATGTLIDSVECSFFESGSQLPVVLKPLSSALDLEQWLRHNRVWVNTTLSRAGAILMRGFNVPSSDDFERCAGVLCDDLFAEYGDLPQTKSSGKIYESTPYPADRSILFHHEGSHTAKWPMKQWFYCVTPAREGGATPIVDGREVYKRLDPSLRDEFAHKGLRYTRNFVEGLDLDWRTFFKANDATAAELKMKEQDLEWEWKGNTLKAIRYCDAFAAHPQTGETVFFNQILLHHPSCLPEQLREALLLLYSEEGLPRSVCFGDGSYIPDDAVGHISRIYERLAVRFQWRAQDFLLLDNMLIAHARDPYVGPRKILVAMGQMNQAPRLAIV